MKKQLTTLRFEIKSIDEEERTFVAVASDASVDRHGEVIEQDGWDLTPFKGNPVVPWGHKYDEPPVAVATEIGVVDGKLMFKPKFATADEYPFADTIWKLYKGGYLRAFSVGFIPKEMEGDTFIKQELLEISAVTVPSNPNALVLAYKEGVIDDSERKSLIGHMKAAVKSLTDADVNKDNTNKSEELDMEKLEELQNDVRELKTGLEEIKSGLDALTELATKNVEKSEDNPTGEGEGDGDDKGAAGDGEGEGDGAGSADSEQETGAEGAEEPTKEETEKAVREAVADALAEARGEIK